MIDSQAGEKNSASERMTSTVLCPISGKVIDRSEVTSGASGTGCEIEPYDGHLYAPFSGKVDKLSDSFRSLSLVSDDGVELLIRVGRGSEEPLGKHFQAYCKPGDSVKEGDLLVDFDLDSLVTDGFDPLTTVTVENSNCYKSVATAADGKVNMGDKLLSLMGKTTDSDK